MARPIASRTLAALAALEAELQSGRFRPGERFHSNRAIARQYHISYQTADRLLGDLERRKLIERRLGSGSFVPGEAQRLIGVQLLFHPRARRKGSFGYRLLHLLRQRLDREGVDVRVSYAKSAVKPDGKRLAVIWECPAVVAQLADAPAVLLNDRPAPGLDAVRLDSVSVDDYSGGVAAAQILLRQTGTRPRLMVLAGPAGDSRSDVRVAGFLSLANGAAVVHSPTWFADDAVGPAERILAAWPAGIFCCNDRLAQAVVETARSKEIALPPLVGFDDAPIAQQLNLTTIAIPWSELVEGAIGVIRRRLRGDNSNASRQVFAVSPVIRSSTLVRLPMV